MIFAKGPFIKDVINQGGGGIAKRLSYLISLFSKNDDEGGRGGQKFRKFDDVFYERPQIEKAISLVPDINVARKY